MKKGLLLIFTALSSLMLNAQTATNFTCNDCSNVNHDLFTELDAGQVIVLCWVMPCNACIGPSVNAATMVQGYVSSNPGQVKFYLVDDSGNTTCTALDAWANNNGIVADANFSNNTISMTDYGIMGMPKIVVLGGGTAHTVFYNENNTFDYHVMQGAIADAVATGVEDHNTNFSAVCLFPNPAKSSAATLTYTLTEKADVTLGIYNTLGEQVKNIGIGTAAPGKHETALDLSALSNGAYFITLTAGASVQTIKFIVAE